MNSLDIHARAMSIAQQIKFNHLQLFEILLQVEELQIYLSFDITSLYTYCVELLQLSPQSAKDFIVVVRKSLEVQALAEALRKQKTTISKARKICPVLTSDNASEWIALACECPTRVIEKAVAQAKPREAAHESMTYVSGDVLEFKLAVTEEWERLLKQTKDLMSQKENRAVTSDEAIFSLMTRFCDKENPVKKAERALKRPSKTNRDLERRGRYRQARVEHEVNLRDQGQCTHIDRNGKRCEAKRWLQKHHIVEFANGGEHTAENLITLCGAHHRIIHRREGVT
jgi:hypothetical protein